MKKNRPVMSISTTTLKEKHLHWTVMDDEYRYTVVGTSGARSKYFLDRPSTSTYASATSMVAYKQHYPMPHDMGDIHNIFFEDSDDEVRLVPRAEFQEASKRGISSRPQMCSDGIFTNTWTNFKSTLTACTFVANKRKVLMPTGRGTM